ncbi:MAG TPA: hypothetical protein ENH23_04205 [candidate division Zixibacteria bacterium]|nr:hypothetical protein [candidate division Zixibacteria bacterium]
MNRSENGSAIIIVLVISIISISLALFTIGVSRKILLSSSMLMDKLHAKMGAESEIEKLKFYLSTGRFHPRSVASSMQIKDMPPVIYIDGTKQTLGKFTNVTLTDTGGLLDILIPNDSRIALLLKNEGMSASKAATVRDSLADWYDKDNFKHLNGAENYYYRSIMGYKYGPRNFAGVQSIDELHLIRGLTDEKVFKKIKSYLTFSPYWMPNINTMNSQLLSATLNISLNMSNILVALRKTKGYISDFDIERITGMRIDPEFYGSFPTRILDIRLNFRFNTAMENISCEISFRPNRTSPYQILKWQS